MDTAPFPDRMAPRFVYEAMRKVDVAEVFSLERECFAPPMTRGHIAYMLKHAARYRWRVMRPRPAPPGSDPEAVWAYACFEICPPQAEIIKLGCQAPHRGKRLGSWMMLHLLREMAGLGVRAVALEVRQSNTVAQRLYHSLGFAVVGERKDYYADGEDAFLMTLSSPERGQWQRQLDERIAHTALEIRRLWPGREKIA